MSRLCLNTSGRLLKNVFAVILNEVKDLEILIEKTRFFAALRMTRWFFFKFFNSFLDINNFPAVFLPYLTIAEHMPVIFFILLL